MAQPSANLRVRISADLADIKQGLGLLRGELAKTKAQASKSLPDGSGFARGLKQARTELIGFVATYASLRSLSVLGTMADEATQLRGRVRAAKGDYEALLALSQETRTGLASTVDLYARMERSTRSQKVNQEELLKITKTVNQAVKLSYAEASTAEGALTQFSQGLASGALRGEELNSVIEGTPVLAEAIAKGMGKTLGELKKMGQEGELTTKKVLGALSEQAGAIAQEFSEVPTTIRDGFTLIRNSFLDYIGDQNEATGAAQRFTNLLQTIARDLPDFFDPLLTATAQLAGQLDDTADAADNVASATDKAGKKTEFMAQAGQFLANVFRVVAAGGIVVKNVVESLVTVVAALGDIAADTARTVGGTLGTALGTLAASGKLLRSGNVKGAFDAYLQGAQKLRDDLSQLPSRLSGKVSTATEILGQQVQDIRDGVGGLFTDIDSASKKLPGRESGSGGGEGGGDPTGGAGKRIAQSNALLRDSVSRALAELDRLYKANEIGLQEYFGTRQQLQEQAIDLEIQQARNELAVTKDLGQRRKLEEDIIKLQRDRAEVGVVAAREQKEAEEQLAKQLGDVKIQLLELDGETGRAERAKLEEQYQELFKRLEAASDETGKAMVRNLIERLVGKAQLNQIKGAADKITGQLQSTETAVGAQSGAGLLGALESETQLKQARAEAITQLVQLRQATLDYLATLDPTSTEAQAARQTLQGINTDIATIMASQQQWRQDVQDTGVNALTTFFQDIKESAGEADEAFRSLVRNFADGLYAMATQALSKRIVSAIGSLFSQGDSSGDISQGATELASAATQTTVAGGVISFGANSLKQAATQLQAAASTLIVANSLSSFSAAHGGGTVGRLQMVRHGINPMVFGAAPRYHVGGVAGLKPGEVPAILQEGERIRTREQEAALQRQLSSGSAGQGVVTTPVVAIGDAAIADALAGASGEQVVLTHVRNNWSGLSRGEG